MPISPELKSTMWNRITHIDDETRQETGTFFFDLDGNQMMPPAHDRGVSLLTMKSDATGINMEVMFEDMARGKK